MRRAAETGPVAARAAIRAGALRRAGAARGAAAALAAGSLLAALPAAGQPLRSRVPGGAAAAVEIVVCASHHHVLAHWLRAAREGRLPRTGVTVVHFDAHPDMAVPSAAVPRGWPARPDRLVASLDIASFQLAAFRTGLVERVVWLRPSWATQLPDGERRFALGATGAGLRVDDGSDYYVLDDGWAPRDRLADPVAVALRVIALDAAAREERLASGPTILDIDLDGFATRNPAAERLRAAGLSDADVARLRELFAPEGLALAEDPAERIAQVEELVAALASLAALETTALPGALFALWQRGLGPVDAWDLYAILSRAGDTAFDTLIEDGRQVVGLPERRPDPDEIAASVRALRDLVGRGAVRPALVTISRSVRDGFTPREAWPATEWALLHALREALGEVRVRFDAGLRPAPAGSAGAAAAPHPLRP